MQASIYIFVCLVGTQKYEYKGSFLWFTCKSNDMTPMSHFTIIMLDQEVPVIIWFVYFCFFVFSVKCLNCHNFVLLSNSQVHRDNDVFTAACLLLLFFLSSSDIPAI